MADRIDIGEVARRTGLTLRALRFYEQRGIVRPLRTAGGRRAYGPGELARLNAAMALRRAGFRLADIAKMLADRPIDLAPLIAAQIAAIDARGAEIARARTMLLSVRARIDRGEPIDLDTLCALIRAGDECMADDAIAQIAARYINDADRAAFAASWSAVPDGFDQHQYAEAWRNLTDRIEAALPLDPAGETAQVLSTSGSHCSGHSPTPPRRKSMPGSYGCMATWRIGRAKPIRDSANGYGILSRSPPQHASRD